MEATSQLNVRMDRSLREAGEAALAEIGYTPAEFVRAAWTRLAQGGDALADARKLAEHRSASAQVAQHYSATPLEEMLGMSDTIKSTLRSMGVVLTQSQQPESSASKQAEQDETALWDAMAERMAEDLS